MKGIVMRSAVLIGLILTVTVFACEREKPPSTQTAGNTTAPVQVESTIAKIVFIDIEDACACTRRRIEGTWNALQAALDSPATLTVERIHADTQAALAERYTLLKPLMVSPGIYFVDSHDAVIEMLQGEVKQEQIAAVLKK
jgi:hypothetical protein